MSTLLVRSVEELVVPWVAFLQILSDGAGKHCIANLLYSLTDLSRSFIGQGPVMLVAIILVAAKLPAHSTSDVVQSEPEHSRLRRIDFFGAFLLAGTVTSFLGALSLGGQTFPWSHPIVIGLLLGSILLSISFVFYENNYAAEPIFPPALLIRREVAAPYAILALQTGAQVGVSFDTLYILAMHNLTYSR
jgi:hypothetical protein